MQKSFRLLIFLLIPFTTLAQRDSTQTRSWGVAYFAQGFSHPGLTASIEQTLMSSRNFQFIVAAKAGIYFHYRNNTGALLMIQSGQRYRIANHFYFEHFLGVGYLQTFLNGGDAYYVNASGQIQKASKIGNPHFMPSISLGLRYELKGSTALFVRPMIYWAIPFNQSSLVQYALEAGVLIRMKR